MVTTPPLHPYFLLPHSPSPSASHPPWAGRYGGLGWELEKGSGLIRCGGAALEQSVWRTAPQARAGGQQGVQCCMRRVRGAGEAGQGRRLLGREGAGILLSPVPPLYPATLLPPALLPYSVPSFPTVVLLSLSLPPFLHLSASLPSLPSLLPVLPSSHPSFLPFFLSSSSINPAPVPLPSPTLPLPSSRQPCSSVPPFYLPLVPCRTFSSHPPIINPPIILSAHPLIRPSSHPPIISSAHHLIRPSSHPHILASAHPLIRPSSHPPILSSAHPLIRPSSHPPIISSAHHLIRPSSHPPIISSTYPLTVAHASALVPFPLALPYPRFILLTLPPFLRVSLAHFLPPCILCSPPCIRVCGSVFGGLPCIQLC
ncbi:unnamed protein product [Closterium sp. NIES-65]|nr:unnamed protein product [Closterium sp. NIES-65]